MIAAGNQRLWEKLCAVIGRTDLLDDPRFASNQARVAAREELRGLLAERLGTEPAGHWLELLDAAGVPCAPINRLDAVLVEEQVLASEAIVAIDHPHIPGYRAVNTPLRDEHGPLGGFRPAPGLGEHNDEVLGAPAKRTGGCR